MTRVRWLAAKWPLSLRVLATRMNGSLFDRDASDGFVLERVRDGRVDGEYIEKYEYEELEIDPFGGEVSTHRVGYRRTRFILTNTFPQIELQDPPRNIGGFSTRLAEINGFAVTIGDVDVDVGLWVDAIIQTTGKAAELRSIQAGRIQFDGGIVGKIYLRGGSEARVQMSRLIRNRVHRIEKVTLNVKQQDGTQAIRLGRRGCAHISGPQLDVGIPLLRRTLLMASNDGEG